MTSRFAVLLAFVAVLSLPSLAHATTVTITDYTGSNADFTANASGGGGAFTATTAGDGTLGDVPFITFCLEFSEHFYPGTTYNYTLSSGAKNGGAGGDNPDPVDDATKWLYYQVVKGYYSSIGAFGTGNVGARVQEAIWLIEQEKDPSDPLIDPLSKALAAYAVLNQNWSTIAAEGWTVWAMNLTPTTGNDLVQDQLAMAQLTTEVQNFEAPEPASLFLLGTGLLFTSLKLIRRKTRS